MVGIVEEVLDRRGGRCGGGGGRRSRRGRVLEHVRDEGVATRTRPRSALGRPQVVDDLVRARVPRQALVLVCEDLRGVRARLLGQDLGRVPLGDHLGGLVFIEVQRIVAGKEGRGGGHRRRRRPAADGLAAVGGDEAVVLGPVGAVQDARLPTQQVLARDLLGRLVLVVFVHARELRELWRGCKGRAGRRGFAKGARVGAALDVADPLDGLLLVLAGGDAGGQVVPVVVCRDGCFDPGARIAREPLGGLVLLEEGRRDGVQGPCLRGGQRLQDGPGRRRLVGVDQEGLGLGGFGLGFRGRSFELLFGGRCEQGRVRRQLRRGGHRRRGVELGDRCGAQRGPPGVVVGHQRGFGAGLDERIRAFLVQGLGLGPRESQ